MNETLTTYSLVIRPAKKLWWFTLPSLLSGLAFAALIMNNTTIRAAIGSHQRLIAFSVLLALAYIQPCIEVLWLLTGKVVITLDKITLTVDRYFMGIRTTTVYKLEDVKNITIMANERSSTFLGFGRGRILGTYYKNPVRFAFEYYGSIKKIGNYCEDFPATELREEIYERKHTFA